MKSRFCLNSDNSGKNVTTGNFQTIKVREIYTCTKVDIRGGFNTSDCIIFMAEYRGDSEYIFERLI